MIGLRKEEGPGVVTKPRCEKNGLCCLAVLSREFSFNWISKSLYSHSFHSTVHAGADWGIALLAISD